MIERYLNLKIGRVRVRSPYFQNIIGKKGRSVFVGKGNPFEIEREANNLFERSGKDLDNFDENSIRHYMLMAGLGVDCSGFVANVLAEFLKEKKLGSIRKHIRPKIETLLTPLTFLFRPTTNISADALTDKINCIAIKDLNEVLPTDLIRFGPKHVAIVVKVMKKDEIIKEIVYFHSTCDYFDQHGVRKGKIVVIDPKKSLEKQVWNETYRGKNWSYQDYISAKEDDRGIRRIKILASFYSEHSTI